MKKILLLMILVGLAAAAEKPVAVPVYMNSSTKNDSSVSFVAAGAAKRDGSYTVYRGHCTQGARDTCHLIQPGDYTATLQGEYMGIVHDGKLVEISLDSIELHRRTK